jgi:hypothetical protein
MVINGEAEGEEAYTDLESQPCQGYLPPDLNHATSDVPQCWS